MGEGEGVAFMFLQSRRPPDGVRPRAPAPSDLPSELDGDRDARALSGGDSPAPHLGAHPDNIHRKPHHPGWQKVTEMKPRGVSGKTVGGGGGNSVWGGERGRGETVGGENGGRKNRGREEVGGVTKPIDMSVKKWAGRSGREELGGVTRGARWEKSGRLLKRRKCIWPSRVYEAKCGRMRHSLS